MPKLSVIIPCYYNEENIPVTTRVLIENEAAFPADTTFEYVLVDDGSKDQTYAALQRFQQLYPDRVTVVKLAGNVGSYNAIVAGMQYATGDVNVILTADMQDPPALMIQMLTHWRRGFKLVIANRAARNEGFAKTLLAETFHWLMKRLALRNVPDGGFDFVLFDRQIKDRILAMSERNSNIFYLMVWMGYDYVSIPYVRQARDIGKSRWTLQKRVKLLIDSLLAFSFFPVRAITVSGLVLGGVALLYALYILSAKLFGAIPVRGWTALMVVVLFVSAFQMIALGIIGEYVWRTLDVARKRPLYVEAEVLPAGQPAVSLAGPESTLAPPTQAVG